jgi:hypothetical protein
MKSTIATRVKIKVDVKEIDSNSKIEAPETALEVRFKQYERDYKSNNQQYDDPSFKSTDLINQALNFFMTDSHEFAFGIYENGEECVYDVNANICSVYYSKKISRSQIRQRLIRKLYCFSFFSNNIFYICYRYIVFLKNIR